VKGLANTVLDLSFASEARVTRHKIILDHVIENPDGWIAVESSTMYASEQSSTTPRPQCDSLPLFHFPCSAGSLIRHTSQAPSAAEREETSSPNFTLVGGAISHSEELAIHVRHRPPRLLLEHSQIHVRISTVISTYDLPFSMPTTHPSEPNRL